MITPPAIIFKVEKPASNLPAITPFEYISGFEGIRFSPYYDSLGNLTVGIGHKLVKGDAIKERYSPDEITQFFKQDLETAVNGAKKIWMNYDKLPHNIQLVLLDLVFNMGIKGVSKFTKMNKAISLLDYQTAAKELRDSLYFKQVGNRAIIHYNELMSFSAK